MEFICLFLPSFISLFIDLNVVHKNGNIYNLIVNYFLYVLINNTVILFLSFIRGINSYLFTVQFSIKYIILSCIIAFGLPYCPNLIKKTITKYREIKVLEKIKKFFIMINKWVKKHKIILLKILIFCLTTIILFSFDFIVRKQCYLIDSFYSLKGISPVLFTLSFTLLFYFLIVYLPKKLPLIIGTMLYILSLVLFIANYMLVRIKSAPLSINDMLYNATEGFEFINFLKKEINFRFVFIVLISITIFTAIFIIRKKMKDVKIGKIHIVVLIAIIFIVHIAAVKSLGNYNNNDFNKYKEPSFYYSQAINSNRLMLVSGLYEYMFKNVSQFISEQKMIRDSEDEINEKLEDFEYQAEENEYTGIFKDKNLIMIMMESVDNVIVNEEDTPTLYNLSQVGWNFTNRYSQVTKSGSTISTEYTSLTGLFDNGSYSKKYEGYYPYSIPNMFKANGYKVTSVHENSGQFYNRKVLHERMGFDNSYFLKDMDVDYIPFDDLQLFKNDTFYNMLVSKDEKFMTFIVTIAAHAPYTDNSVCNTDKQAKSNEKSCLAFLANNTDDMIAELLLRLEEDGLLEDTVIVMYTDHFAYAYTYTDEDYAIYNQIDDNFNIKNIPLVIYSPNIEHEDFDMLVNDIDIAPTIYNLFGMDYNPKYLLGRDVFSSEHKDLLMFLDYSWYDGDIYSLNAGSTLSSSYGDNSSYTEELLDLNKLIINSNYYKTTK